MKFSDTQPICKTIENAKFKNPAEIYHEKQYFSFHLLSPKSLKHFCPYSHNDGKMIPPRRAPKKMKRKKEKWPELNSATFDDVRT